MEGGGRFRLSRLLNKLRGDHHKNSLDKGISFMSTAMSESTGCGSTDAGKYSDKAGRNYDEAGRNYDEAGRNYDEAGRNDDEAGREYDESGRGYDEPAECEEETSSPPHATSSIDDDQFAANIDLRYGGQYLTPEQLPTFCEQLHHLVQVIRNIQSYAKVTGEYPTSLEKRLEREAREVAALAAETRNARDVIARTRLQRRALHDNRRALEQQLTSLKDTEVRELESTVRLSDRKLYKSWEALKDTSDPAAFEPLLEEIRNKQSALQCLVRLVSGRRASLQAPPVRPLPLPTLPNDTEESMSASAVRKRDSRRNKRRRREPRSVPLSSQPSTAQVRLYIQGAESTTLPALDLPSGGSVRDILFFTTNTS